MLIYLGYDVRKINEGYERCKKHQSNGLSGLRL